LDGEGRRFVESEIGSSTIFRGRTEDQGRTRSVVTVVKTGRGIGLGGAVEGGDRADESLEFGGRNDAGPEQNRTVAGEREHGGFNSHGARSAIEEEGHAGHADVAGLGGTQLRESVGAGSGDRDAGLANQGKGEGVGRDADADGRKTRSDKIRDDRKLGEDESERSRPIAFGESGRRVRPVRDEGARHVDT
jgi:hypothetical protein